MQAGLDWAKRGANTPNNPNNTPLIQTLTDRYTGSGRYVYSTNVGLYLPNSEVSQQRTITLSSDTPMTPFQMDTNLIDVIHARKTPESGDYITQDFGTVLINVWIARKY